MHRRLSQLVILALIVAVSTAQAQTRQALPGLLDAATMRAAEAKARQQKADAQTAVKRHAKTLGYTSKQIGQALMPAMQRTGTFQVALNDGTVVEFPWHRTGFAENRLANTGKAIARDAAGNALRHETNKGGVRLHYGVFADEVYALALKMDTKLATARDALGSHAIRGAKGGIGAGRVIKVGTRYKARVGDHVDPAAKIFNRATIMKKFAQSYVAAGGAVGPGLDVQAGDVNTKAPEMKVLAEQGYGSRRKPSAGVSGKALRRYANGSINPAGGIAYRATSTGDGVWMTTRLAARRAGLKVRGATVVAQGWGEVGRAFGDSAVRNGARVIAIQELWTVNGARVAGTLHNPHGAAAKPRHVKQWLAEVNAFRASGKDLKTYKGGSLMKHFVAGQDASAVKADIVGINAMGNVLTKTTVPAYVKSGTHQGKRKILAEGANLAQTRDGARLLDRHASKLLTVTGDLANLGGVHVSDMEAAQNFYGEAVTSRRAKLSLLGTMRSGWNRAMKLADKQGISERKAIELAAVDGMMKRSLHLKGAPRSAMERRVISSARRKSLGTFGQAMLKANPFKQVRAPRTAQPSRSTARRSFSYRPTRLQRR